ncbi:MAG: hypothetical protein ABIZ80_21305, partial [Bryobacteraceae bacterium]
MKPLTSGMSWDCQPRYSPDGKSLAFISDRSGSDNVWIMNADGTNLRALTSEKRFLLGSPTWSPDGRYILARRWGQYPLESYLRKSELWLFHLDGGGGVQLTKGDAKHTRVSGPAFSPDGKYIYFSSIAGRYVYNAELGKWQLQRMNRETGEIHTMTSNYGGGFRPSLTPDGRQLIYATRRDAVTGLRVRDLETRAERWISRRITRDDQEGFAAEDTLPAYAVSRDSKFVYLTIGGRIHRLTVATGENHDVLFNAAVKRDLGKLVKFTDSVSDGPFNVKQMRWLQSSEDGARMIFSAIGKLWATTGGNAPPVRLTASAQREYAPSLSPDGKWIAYVTWNDRDGGRLWKVPSAGGPPIEISTAPALYAGPQWSPDGARIAFLLGTAAGWLSDDSADVIELRTVSSAGGKSDFVTQMRSSRATVIWSSDSKRLYYSEFQQAPAGSADRGSTTLVSIRTDGVDKKTHLKVNDGLWIFPSPDGQWALLLRNSNLYLSALPKGVGEAPLLNMESPSIPLKQVTLAGAQFPRWSPDSEHFTYAFTNHLYRGATREVLAAAKPADLKPNVTAIAMTAPRNIAHGVLALRNVRAITVKGDEV